MTDKTQPEALRLADWLQAAVQAYPQMSEDEPGGYASEVDQIMDEAAAELRRQHTRIAELEQEVAHADSLLGKANALARIRAHRIAELQARVQELGAMARENRSRRIVELEAQLEAVGAGGVQALSAAPVEVADAMADSQYLAGVSAGWNAANADDPNEALRKLHESRAGYLKPLDAARKQGGAARLTYEQAHAIRQGHEIAASDGYFEARPQIDSNDRRKVFQAGFERGWDAARKQAAPKAAPWKRLTREQIREVFMANGFTIKEGQTDLKQYVYDAAHALLELVAAPQQEAQKPCQTCASLARTVMLDQVSFDRKPDGYGIRQITDDEAVEAWEDIRTSPDVAREEAKDMMATGRGEIYEVVPLWTTPQPAPAPLSDDAKDAARWRWLRENWFTMTSSYYQQRIAFKVGEPRWSDITETELEAAIDAAIAAQGEKDAG